MSDLYTFDAEGMRRIAAAVRDFERQLKNLNTPSPGQRGSSTRTTVIGKTLDEISRGSPEFPFPYRVHVWGRTANGLWFATDEIRDCEEIGMIHPDRCPVPVDSLAYQRWANGVWVYDGHDCTVEPA